MMDDKQCTIEIEEGTKVISKKTYYNQRFLKHVIIPDSVEEIEAWAFANCNALSVVELNSDCRIALDAFANCMNLERIIIRKELPYDLSFLLAQLFMRFQEYIIYDLTDIGSEAWMNRVDERIRKELNSPIEEGFHPFLAGGEEDYEGKENDLNYYVEMRERNRYKLLYERLLLGDGSDWQWDYLSKSKLAFKVIVEESSRQKEYYSIYREANLIKEDMIDALLDMASDAPELAAKLMVDCPKHSIEMVFDEYKL